MVGEQGPARTALIFGAGIASCLLLVWAASEWPTILTAPTVRSDFPLSLEPATAHVVHPLVELAKLVVAALVGLLVTVVHKQYKRDRPVSRSLEHAQVLLCVSGALMMIIIGNSTARALGIAGGASIIRFRTPVEDPKDTILLFLLLGLGMSVGLGAFAVCGLSTAFLCMFLLMLDRFGERKPRAMLLDLVSSTKDFPTEHVHRVLASTVNFYEPLKVAQGTEAVMRYSVKLDQSTSLAYLSAQLMDNGASGLKSVSWEQPKKD